VLLALDAPDEAYAHVSAELPALSAAGPELHRKAGALQLPMAEALRRLGRPDAAAALRSGLSAARASRLLGVGLAGTLVTAAVLQDAGDSAAAAELAAGWQQVRLTLGLPVPAAYRQAARDLDLDLTPGDPVRARAAGADLEALLSRAVRAVRAVGD